MLKMVEHVSEKLLKLSSSVSKKVLSIEVAFFKFLSSVFENNIIFHCNTSDKLYIKWSIFPCCLTPHVPRS